MRILALCASQRTHSANRALMLAAERILEHHQWIQADLFHLPFFDPELQYSEFTPPQVMQLRAQALHSEVLFIATPEYAHALPGVLKNALEWLFHEGMEKKPVYLVIGSGEGESTRHQMLEILTTMDFKVNLDQTMIVRGVRSKISPDGRFLDAETASSFHEFCAKIEKAAPIQILNPLP